MVIANRPVHAPPLIPADNAAGEDIPKFSIAKVDSLSSGVPQLVKPDADNLSPALLVITGGAAIPAGATGALVMPAVLGIGWATYNGAAPSTGDQFGTVEDQWYGEKGNTGFTALGAYETDTLAMVAPDTSGINDEFLLTPAECPYWGRATDWEIQAADRYGTALAAYEPDTQVDLTISEGSVSPTSTDSSGWSSGAKTVTITPSGGSGEFTLFADDADSGLDGKKTCDPLPDSLTVTISHDITIEMDHDGTEYDYTWTAGAYTVTRSGVTRDPVVAGLQHGRTSSNLGDGFYAFITCQWTDDTWQVRFVMRNPNYLTSDDDLVTSKWVVLSGQSSVMCDPTGTSDTISEIASGGTATYDAGLTATVTES